MPADIRVYFARTSAAAKSLEAPALVVMPQANSWNDYSHKLYAQLLVRYGDDWTQVPIAIGFEGEQSTYDYLVEQHRTQGDLIEASLIGKPFISLQKATSAYGVLVERLGFDAAIHGLRALQDVVLGQLEGDERILSLADTDAFHIGMIRNAPNYVAFRRGGQHLRRTPAPVVADAAKSFQVRAEVPFSESEIIIDLDFEPDPIFDDRCCVLIGRNGVGKTQMLRSILDGVVTVAKEDEVDDDRGRPRLQPPPVLRRLLVFSSVPSDPYPRSIPPWSGVDYEYLALIADDAPLGSDFQTAVLDCMRDDGSEFGEAGRRSGRLKLLEALLGQLGLWDALHMPVREDRLEQFTPIYVNDQPYVRLSGGFNELRLNLLFHVRDWERPAIVLNRLGQARRLSSGELAMATFVARAVAAIENGSLLLFDEPETHLHPNYVTDFMDVLQDLLMRTRSVAVIATHSAYIVREVPKQRVNILQHRLSEQHDDDDDDSHDQAEDTGPRFIDVVRPRLQTFGSNVDDISRFVFGDGLISPRYQRALRAWVKGQGSGLTIGRVLRRHGRDLNTETLSFIARLIRDRSET